MTDNEIKKALEEHYRQVDAGYSTHLEYGGKGDEHEEKYIYMLRDALDLINRQQAEIETLRVNVKASKRIIQRLKERILMSKAEAIKEFVKQLKKEKYYGSNRMGYGAWVVELDDIDNLAKEKVGDAE